jgi:hypothetical protein
MIRFLPRFLGTKTAVLQVKKGRVTSRDPVFTPNVHPKNRCSLGVPSSREPQGYSAPYISLGSILRCYGSACGWSRKEGAGLCRMLPPDFRECTL